MSQNNKSINVILPTDAHAKLKQLAANDQRTVRVYTKLVLSQHIDRQFAKLEASKGAE